MSTKVIMISKNLQRDMSSSKAKIFGSHSFLILLNIKSFFNHLIKARKSFSFFFGWSITTLCGSCIDYHLRRT